MTRPSRTASAVALACLLLAACGGETSNPPATSTDNSGTPTEPQPTPTPTPTPATYYQTKTPYTFANTGTYAFTSSDGKFTNTLKGDGKTKIASAVDAVNVLYNLLQVAPAMTAETGGVTMEKYIGAEQAQTLAYLQDAEDYYQKGPGIQEANPVTYRMAKVLQDDFFNEVDAIARGDLTRAAKLRFTHAEIVIPFASIMNLKNVFVPTPQAQTYTYANNPWRGDQVSPMAANMQWDVYRNGSRLIVKMLYNERETDFQAACDGAKLAPASHFYDYAALKRCYGYQ